MKLLQALVTVAALHTIAGAQKVVPVTFGRQSPRLPALHKRADTYSQELNNNLTGGGYYAEVSLGTPPQPVNLILDTGSSDVWVLDSHANLCRSEKLQAYYGGCIATYNPDNSSTYEVVSRDTFSIEYVDGSGAEGDYIKDDFHIGNATIEALQMGLAENSTINSGLLGIGFAANVAADKPYKNIINLFEEQGLIGSQAYSLYLDDLSADIGTILFGGLDTKKYIGELKAVKIQPDTESETYSSFTVALNYFSITADNGTATNYTRTAIPVLLDSGTTLTYLPSSIATSIYRDLDAVDDTSGTGLVYISCDHLDNNKNLTFDFQFGGDDGPVIHVPIDEMVLDNVEGYVELGLTLPNLPFKDVCSFGIQPGSGYYLLGDTFLRSAYVVYDLTNKEIALAPANLNSTESNVVEISSKSGIPDVTGVAAQVSAEQTATGLPGNNGGSVPTTTAATSTDSPDGSASSTGSAGIKAVPAPNWEVATVAVIAGVYSLMGVGLLTL